MKTKHLYFSAGVLTVIVGCVIIFGRHTSRIGAPASFTATPSATLASMPSHCFANGLLPDPMCTPGAINTNVTQSNIQSTICVSGFTKTIRPPVQYTNQLKVAQIKAYGFTDTNVHDYEEDHEIPLEVAGNPTDIKNLWPQPLHIMVNGQDLGAKTKDRVENETHKLVCSGKMLLQDAQAEISFDWVALGKKEGVIK